MASPINSFQASERLKYALMASTGRSVHQTLTGNANDARSKAVCGKVGLTQKAVDLIDHSNGESIKGAYRLLDAYQDTHLLGQAELEYIRSL